MISTIRLLKTAAAIGVAIVFSAGAALAGGATPDDTAKFIAGLQPSAGSPLAELAKDKSWEQYAKSFDTGWKSVEDKQISKVRAWSAANLQQPQPTLFYMFSGPDFLYADAFFPKAATYVLAGLELPGEIPDLSGLKSQQLGAALNGLRFSLNNILNHSFFVTSEMGRDLYRHRLSGTIPVLYVFLARTGKTIQDVSFVALDKEGVAHPADEAGLVAATKGVKIVFTSGGGQPQTLYYFKTDLSNKGTKDSGFLKFCEKLGTGNALIKSASYLLHGSDFSNARDLLLKQSASIVQDDTGIPYRMFNLNEWQVIPFGRYTRPIPVFRYAFQPKLDELFQKQKPAPLEFSIGYRWRESQSSLILAVKTPKQASADQAAGQ